MSILKRTPNASRGLGKLAAILDSIDKELVIHDQAIDANNAKLTRRQAMRERINKTAEKLILKVRDWAITQHDRLDAKDAATAAHTAEVVEGANKLSAARDKLASIIGE